MSQECQKIYRRDWRQLLCNTLPIRNNPGIGQSLVPKLTKEISLAKGRELDQYTRISCTSEPLTCSLQALQVPALGSLPHPLEYQVQSRLHSSKHFWRGLKQKLASDQFRQIPSELENILPKHFNPQPCNDTNRTKTLLQGSKMSSSDFSFLSALSKNKKTVYLSLIPCSQHKPTDHRIHQAPLL